MHMSRSLLEVTEPSIQQLSQSLGVPELRYDRHALRDHRSWLNDKIGVRYLWHALVLPSFHPSSQTDPTMFSTWES